MPEECKPEEAPCSGMGISHTGYFYSIHKRLCDLIAWAAGIFDNTKISPLGKVAIFPAHAFINAGVERVVSVPAGALSIQAIIDNDYASTYRLGVKPAGQLTFDMCPAGTDFLLPAITPLYVADSVGRNSTQGHGTYPAYSFQIPAGSRGAVTALYTGGQQVLTVAPPIV